MKRPKLGDAMFEEDDVFENIFAAINVCPKLGDATFNEDDIFSLPSFDMQICNDDSMPPTYDDYCDDTCAIKSSDYIYKTCHDYDYPFSEHYSFNVKQFIVFESLMMLPLFRMRRILLMWRVISFLCFCVMKIMLYVMAILLNSFMMLLKIIMREEYMLVGIALISSFLSMC